MEVVGVCLSPVLVWDAVSLRAPREWSPCPMRLLSWEDVSLAKLWQMLVLFQGDRVYALIEDDNMAIGVSNDWCRMMLSSNAFMVLAALTMV